MFYTLFYTNEIPYSKSNFVLYVYCTFPVYISYLEHIFTLQLFKIKSEAIFLTIKENPFDNRKIQTNKTF